MKGSLLSEIYRLRFVCLVLAALISAPPMCHGQKLVLLGRDDQPSHPQLQTAARFYGLQIQPVHVSSGSVRLALDQIKKNDVLGVVATADSLSLFSRESLLSALRHEQGRNIPLLIIEIKPETGDILKEWSDGVLPRCNVFADSAHRAFYQAGSDPEVTRQLSNETFPAVSRSNCGFQIDADRKPALLLSVSQAGASVPVFVRIEGSPQSVFFLADQTSPTGSASVPSDVVSTFSAAAPFLMFVRYAAGEFAWHSPHSMANFTIDDPWLTEPYGYLSYRALLREMEKHNFHTTIAFIPWNFNRSQSEVAALFRDHSDRLSIAIHGNNHDHKEFDEYKTVPLVDQVADIKQSLARMEEFSRLTRISYDRVMVFPHSIAPQETLAQLKSYGFLATVNADDVPMGADRPTAPNFYLRPYTVDFAGFPSLKRFSSEVPLPRTVISINAFLGNPLMFYGHAVMFEPGIETFSATADTVNSMNPSIEWRSLGYIAEHLCLIRSRADDALDVRMFGNNLVLDNPSTSERVYWVRKADNAQPPIKLLAIDGEAQTFERDDDEIAFRVAIPARSSKHIQIQYVNDLELSNIPVTDPTLRLTLLREASDLRDIVLPKHRWGRWVASFYYHHQIDSLETDVESRWLGLAFISGLGILLGSIGRWFLKLRTNRSVANPAGVSK
jgi:hypothetical protein